MEGGGEAAALGLLPAELGEDHHRVGEVAALGEAVGDGAFHRARGGGKARRIEAASGGAGAQRLVQAVGLAGGEVKQQHVFMGAAGGHVLHHAEHAQARGAHLCGGAQKQRLDGLPVAALQGKDGCALRHASSSRRSTCGGTAPAVPQLYTNKDSAKARGAQPRLIPKGAAATRGRRARGGPIPATRLR